METVIKERQEDQAFYTSRCAYFTFKDEKGRKHSWTMLCADHETEADIWSDFRGEKKGYTLVEMHFVEKKEPL